jgi:hypothetical protein
MRLRKKFGNLAGQVKAQSSSSDRPPLALM